MEATGVQSEEIAEQTFFIRTDSRETSHHPVQGFDGATVACHPHLHHYLQPQLLALLLKVVKEGT